jgi:hypothetical protein
VSLIFIILLVLGVSNKKKDSNTEMILLTFYELRAVMCGLVYQNSVQNWTFIT